MFEVREGGDGGLVVVNAPTQERALDLLAKHYGHKVDAAIWGLAPVEASRKFAALTQRSGPLGYTQDLCVWPGRAPLNAKGGLEPVREAGFEVGSASSNGLLLHLEEKP